MNRRWPHGPVPSDPKFVASSPRGLYLITPDDDDTMRLTHRVAPLLAEGVTWLQYRNKTAGQALRHEQASALQARCAAAGVPLIINDDVRLAKAVGATGVHLGEDDGDIAAARVLLGDHAIIGASCYDELARAERAVANGADYVAFGAFFPTRSKTGTRQASPDLLAAAEALNVPRVAIGGITPDNAASLIAAGADLVAVIGGVFDAADPVAAIRAYRDCFALDAS
ncbi:MULTISPECIES: thiamine phosphate synthase [unclassified Pseudoxanthomonas]|uniref:thiamine phosphate synthase n=1 Tax=unclassified Pseudoxanthomonas TaxID=2645906 RepID=UPI00307816D0